MCSLEDSIIDSRTCSTPLLGLDKAHEIEYAMIMKSTFTGSNAPCPVLERVPESWMVDAISVVDRRYFSTTTVDVTNLFSACGYHHPAVTKEQQPVGEESHFFNFPVCFLCHVLRRLQLRPGDKFLNVGSGSGYVNYFVARHLGPFGVNHGLETNVCAFLFALEKSKEIHLCIPQLKNQTAVPVFKPCHVSELPNGLKYDAILCSSVISDSDLELVRSLLTDGGSLVCPFRMEDEVDGPLCNRNGQNIFVDRQLMTRLSMDLQNVYMDLRGKCSKAQKKTILPEILYNSHKNSFDTLHKMCLKKVNKHLQASLKVPIYNEISIIADWKTMISVPHLQLLKETQCLLQKVNQSIMSFCHLIEREEKSIKDIFSAMQTLTEHLFELKKGHVEFPDKKTTFVGMMYSYTCPPVVCHSPTDIFEHLDVLPSTLRLLVREIMWKANKQDSVLTGIRLEKISEDSLRLEKEWMTSFSPFLRFCINRLDEHLFTECKFDSLVSCYRLEYSICLGFWISLNDIVAELTDKMIQQFALHERREEIFQSDSMKSKIQVLKWKVKNFRLANHELLKEARLTPTNPGNLVKSLNRELRSLVGHILCSVRLRSIVRAVSNSLLRLQLGNLLWSLNTANRLAQHLAAFCEKTSSAITSEQCYISNIIHVPLLCAVSEKFRTIARNSNMAANGWSSIVYVLMLILHHYLSSATELMSLTSINTWTRYNAALKTLELPLTLKQDLQEAWRPA